MKILVISGSRNRQGQTARAINAICKGVAAGGGTSETIFLPELKLELCRQCNKEGWGLCQSEGRCVIEDDFASIVEKIQSADAVVFANPVYFGDLTECLRGFLDRYRRLRFSMMIKQPPKANAGFAPGTNFGGTPAIGYCYAGGSGMGTLSACANLEKILQTCGFDIVDMIPARRQNLEAKLPILELTGKWLTTKPSSGPAWIPPEARTK